MSEEESRGLINSEDKDEGCDIKKMPISAGPIIIGVIICAVGISQAVIGFYGTANCEGHFPILVAVQGLIIAVYGILLPYYIKCFPNHVIIRAIIHISGLGLGVSLIGTMVWIHTHDVCIESNFFSKALTGIWILDLVIFSALAIGIIGYECRIGCKCLSCKE